MEPQPIWRIMYADDASIVSRPKSSLAKMMADTVAVCASSGLTVPEAKTGTMCLVTKCFWAGLCSFIVDCPRGTSKLPSLCILGQPRAKIPSLLSISTGACHWPAYVSDDLGLPPYDPPRSGSKYERPKETMMYRCITWSPTVVHLAILHTVHRRLFCSCIARVLRSRASTFSVICFLNDGSP